METTILLNLDDLIEFHLYKQRRSWVGRLRMLAFVFLPLLIVSLALYMLYRHTNGQLQFSTHMLPCLSLLPIVWWLLDTASRWFLRRRICLELKADPNESMLGEYRVNLSPNDVAIEQPAGAPVCIPWHGIAKVLANADYAYLFTNTEYAIILPQRCFADHNYFQAFVRMAVTYHWSRETSDRTLPEQSIPSKAESNHASAAVQNIPMRLAGLSSEPRS